MAVFALFDSRQRNAGTYTSQGALNVAPPGSQVILRPLLSAADVADPSLTIRFAIEAPYDANAATWVPLLSVIWQGGGTDHHGNPRPAPTFSYSTSSGWPRHYRVVLDLPRRMALGAEVETR